MKNNLPANYWKSRTALLLGDETLEKLNNKRVLVAGLGGVGGICAEMLVRCGIGKITIVDADVVDLSNCNRQIIALQTNVGENKVDVLKERLLQINPDLEVVGIKDYLKDDKTNNVLDEYKYDYIVDCIDTLSPKVFFIKACIDRKLKIISSLGAGGKIDPSRVVITDISKTYECNLARYVRKYLHKIGIYSNLRVVFSPEKVNPRCIIETPKAFPKKSIIGTLATVTNTFGIYCASGVIEDLIQN